MPAMKCHYEVLGVDRNIDDDGLKKAYRKLALKWHPDKNKDREEECTKYFTVIQSAYDVLSDPQERAWYDNHREAIINGGFGEDYNEDFINLMQYFTTTAYSGHGDDDKGFYAVYGDVFNKIAEEDRRFMDIKDSDDDQFPELGNTKSSFEEVVHPFYAYWYGYSTARSFVWVEKYDTREAPNRRVARLMEKDNKKLRDASKKEWNEQVRQLAAFVRKRDKRVQANKKRLEEKAVERSKLDAEKRDKQRRERAKMFEEYNKQGDAAREEMEDDLKAMEQQLAEEFGKDSSSESDSAEDVIEDDLDDLFCIACNKAFKSDKAFFNHEKSRKHKENVAYIKQQLTEENSLGISEDSIKNDLIDWEEGDGGGEEVEELPSEMQNGDVIKDEEEKGPYVGLDDLNIEDGIAEQTLGVAGEEEEDVEKPVRTKLSKKQKKRRKQQNTFNIENHISADLIDDITAHLPNSIRLVDDKGELDADVVKGEKTGQDLAKDKMAGQDDEKTSQDETMEKEVAASEVTSNTEIESQAPPMLKGKKAKEARKKAREAATNKEEKPVSEIPLICNKCHHEFPSKNKLFDHLKTTGHALKITPGGASGAKVIMDKITEDGGRGKKSKKKGKKNAML